jgi:hypothetical protein
MMAHGVERRRDRLARFPAGNRAGQFCLLGVVCAAGLLLLIMTANPAWAGNISLTLSGSVDFLDDDPDLVPVLGPETIILEVKAVGRRNVPWTLTLMADSDLRSGSDIIPISVVSWTAFPNPPYQNGTLSVMLPSVIASGLTHEHAWVNLDFVMQNSWSYSVGTYSATATFTLAAP